MLKTFYISSVLIISSAVALPAFACDMHGGAFGFSNPNASWQSYNPQASTIDPSLIDPNTGEAYSMTPVPATKKRPSFSNAANRASMIAKARVARKAKAKAKDSPKAEAVKKTSLNLNADR